jgi:hypothetical protein
MQIPDEIPIELHERISNYLRHVTSPKLDPARQHDLLRALDGFGVTIGNWHHHHAPPLVEIEVLTETGDVNLFYIELALLGIVVDGDLLGFVPEGND